MVNTAPVSGPTQAPGFEPNFSTSNTTLTHTDWVQAFVDYWAARWASGDHTVPAGWNDIQFGSPDPNDSNNTASPRTLLAFSRYAQAYKPGMDPSIDAFMPYIPPGPNDFIETPVQTAARVAQNNWQLTYDQTQRQNDIANGLQDRQLDLNELTIRETAKANAMQAFNQAFGNELNRYSTQANVYGTQVQAGQNTYGTQAGMYNVNEGNRSTNLQTAGTLAGALQQLYDERTGKAIDLQANPSDIVAREYAVRALQEPQGTTQPAYQNVDSLMEVIKRLIDYQPTKQPTAPTLPPAPATPTTPSWAEVQNVGNAAGAQVQPSIAQAVSPKPASPASAPAAAAPASPQGMTIGGVWYPLQPGTVAMAAGGTTRASQMIVGDEQVPGVPNPERVSIDWKNHTTQVMPMRPDNIARAAMLQRSMGGRGQPNRAQGVKSTFGPIRAYAYGTDNPPNANLTSYPDEVYQNFPSLKYLQGGLGEAAYNTLKTGSAAGAFGTRAPESGSINYGRYLDIARDPVSEAALGSIYSSANRSLMSAVAAAKARAPFGQAVQTSLVRT